MEPKKPITIGVDVSKNTLDAALLLNDDSYIAKSFSNDASGIKQLLSGVAKHGGQSCPIGVEATGGLEQALCNLGYEAEHPIQKVMPTRIANYRKSLTLRNKTDYDDADN